MADVYFCIRICMHCIALRKTEKSHCRACMQAFEHNKQVALLAYPTTTTVYFDTTVLQ